MQMQRSNRDTVGRASSAIPNEILFFSNSFQWFCKVGTDSVAAFAKILWALWCLCRRAYTMSDKTDEVTEIVVGV